MLNNIPMVNSDIVTGISLMLIFVAFGISPVSYTHLDVYKRQT